jgi:hypothetical protein
MGIKFENKKEIQKYIRDYSKRIESVLIREMEIVVAKLENHAKDNAGYNDITGNLKNSIGGVVLKDGIPVQYSGFGGGEGGSTGESFINSLISNYGSGFVIIIVAGMDYATYVENVHQLNVLKKSELLLPIEMEKMFNRVEKALDKAV